jgi:hypothetical protein
LNSSIVADNAIPVTKKAATINNKLKKEGTKYAPILDIAPNHSKAATIQSGSITIILRKFMTSTIFLDFVCMALS